VSYLNCSEKRRSEFDVYYYYFPSENQAYLYPKPFSQNSKKNKLSTLSKHFIKNMFELSFFEEVLLSFAGYALMTAT
jgi:hypothetical protein